LGSFDESETAFYGQIGDQSEFHEPWNRIFAGKHGFNVKAAEGLAEVAETKAPSSYIPAANP
jgi:hypothetical protein